MGFLKLVGKKKVSNKNKIISRVNFPTDRIYKRYLKKRKKEIFKNRAAMLTSVKVRIN
jgi:hypothetical protein